MTINLTYYIIMQSIINFALIISANYLYKFYKKMQTDIEADLIFIHDDFHIIRKDIALLFEFYLKQAYVDQKATGEVEDELREIIEKMKAYKNAKIYNYTDK